MFLFYAEDGSTIEDESKALAKQTDSKYYVRVGTGGARNAGSLLNPLNNEANVGSFNKIDIQRGKPRYEFRRVNETIFNDYIKFLKTKNVYYLNIAQREFKTSCLQKS